MTDKDLSEKVREIAEKMHRHANHNNVRGTEEEYVRLFADQLEALLPAPPRPTLAGMTLEEREERQWMQADVKDVFGRWVITYPCDDDGYVGVVSDSGWPELFPANRVTPRPDLPRLEWPGDKKPDPAPGPAPALPDGWRLADHPDHGRVIVTNTTPDRYGRVCYVFPASKDGMGFNWLFCGHDELTYLDGDQ